jgi:hypothetical protein
MNCHQKDTPCRVISGEEQALENRKMVTDDGEEIGKAALYTLR